MNEEVFVITAAWQFVSFSSCYCLNSLSSLKLKAIFRCWWKKPQTICMYILLNCAVVISNWWELQSPRALSSVDLPSWISQLHEHVQPWCPNKSKLTNVTLISTGLTSVNSLSDTCLQVLKSTYKTRMLFFFQSCYVCVFTGFFHLRVPESSAVGSAVGRIKAHDLDVGRNAEVEYTIVPGDGGTMFDITTNEHNQEGIIILKKVQSPRRKRERYNVNSYYSVAWPVLLTLLNQKIKHWWRFSVLNKALTIPVLIL